VVTPSSRACRARAAAQRIHSRASALLCREQDPILASCVLQLLVQCVNASKGAPDAIVASPTGDALVTFVFSPVLQGTALDHLIQLFQGEPASAHSCVRFSDRAYALSAGDSPCRGVAKERLALQLQQPSRAHQGVREARYAAAKRASLSRALLAHQDG
jgi:hypothetical protein